MAWYHEAVFYHIYPLGLTGAPKVNSYDEPVSRINELIPWLKHIKELGCTALYIGPLFESVGHGYETTDYYKLDSRLGTNEDLTAFVSKAHSLGIRVIFDGVFNHTGRDFFAFRDIQKNREASPYRDWYCNVNFYGNNEYNDGFSYENWGGYNLLVKLNQRNPAVISYICDVIRYWVNTFDVDGIRLDAADVLDFEFMKALRRTANEVKPDFYLMGEVIHGDYTRWTGGDMLHAVTNYTLHKALFSGHNDHNYFEIAHTVKRLNDMGSVPSGSLGLYNFVDNHDVERIHTKLWNKAQFVPVHILLYTLPGVPSIYYGSEFAIDGRKMRGGGDDEIRPALDLSALEADPRTRAFADLIAILGAIRGSQSALSYGAYREIMLTNRQYAFARTLGQTEVLTVVNNDENDWSGSLPAGGSYIGALSGERYEVRDGRLQIHLAPCSGEILIPADANDSGSRPEDPAAAENLLAKAAEASREPAQPVTASEGETAPAETNISKDSGAAAEALEAKADEKTPVKEAVSFDPFMPYEEMTVEQLQAAILAKMAANGPVTQQMQRDVEQNIWRDSLLNWVKSFR